MSLAELTARGLTVAGAKESGRSLVESGHFEPLVSTPTASKNAVSCARPTCALHLAETHYLVTHNGRFVEQTAELTVSSLIKTPSN